MKKITLLLFITSIFTTALFAEDMVSYSKGNASDSVIFNDIFRLSDSTFLIAGETKGNLSWTGVSPTTITIPQLKDTFVSTRIGFILHLSKDMKTVLHAVKMPDNTIENIYKIRSTNAPGQTTGVIYISGKWKERQDTSKGYFIAKLNQNFLTSVPSQCVWIKYINAKNIQNYGALNDGQESYHRSEQPWDVDNLGRVIWVDKTEFRHDKWVTIRRFKADGTDDIMEQNISSYSFATYDATPHDGINNPVVGKNEPFKKVNVGDSLIFKLTYKNKSNNDSTGYPKLKVDSVLNTSYFLFKHSGTEGKVIRSMTDADMAASTLDENGNTRIGKYPYDFIYWRPFYYVKYKTSFMNGSGIYGHSPSSLQMNTAKIGDITIDKRNNHFYFGYTHACSNGNWDYADYSGYNVLQNLFDLECAVVALNDSGKIKWWARTYQQVESINQAIQMIDRLAVDYKNNKLVVLGKTYDTCLHNFWEGDKLKANPGGSGFKNRWTGSIRTIEYAWLGRYSLDTLKIDRATYIAEYDKDSILHDTLLTDPNLDGWADPNKGNRPLGKTVCNDLKIDDDGNIYVACQGNRTITTIDAYQKMVKPDKDLSLDSVACYNSFVRKYNSNLSNILYSSLITGDWDRISGIGGDNTHINRVLPIENKLIAIGYYKGEGRNIQTYSTPIWGCDTAINLTAIFASLDLRPKIKITKYPFIVAKGIKYKLAFNLPSEYSLTTTNQFKLYISDSTGRFNQSTEVGYITGNKSDTILFTIPISLTTDVKGKLRIISTEKNLFSNPVDIILPEKIKNRKFSKPLGDSSFCYDTTKIYTIKNPGFVVVNWKTIPDTASIILTDGSATDTSVSIIWKPTFSGKAYVYTQMIGSDTILNSDTLAINVGGLSNLYIFRKYNNSETQLIARPNKNSFTYQWYYNNVFILTDEKDSIYIASKNPSKKAISVWVKDSIGCLTKSKTINAFSDIYEINNNERFLTYPSPSKDIIKIRFSKSFSGIIEIILTDMLGNKVKTTQLNGVITNQIETIDVSSLNSGIYFVIINDGVKQISEKIIIQ